MEDNRILRLVYTFFLGVLLALFVGFGIQTFYAPPEAPKYPVEINTSNGKEPTPEQQQKEREFETLQRDHEEKMKPYNRNVSIISLIIAVMLLAISILFEKKIKLISDGVMLGGLFVVVYSIGRGVASSDSKYVFGTLAVGLVVVLYFGYHRFVKVRTSAKLDEASV